MKQHLVGPRWGDYQKGQAVYNLRTFRPILYLMDRGKMLKIELILDYVYVISSGEVVTDWEKSSCILMVRVF